MSQEQCPACKLRPARTWEVTHPALAFPLRVQLCDACRWVQFAGPGIQVKAEGDVGAVTDGEHPSGR